jgi:hypothetical protein
VGRQEVPTSGAITVQGTLAVPPGQKLSADSPTPGLIEALQGNQVVWESVLRVQVDAEKATFQVTLPAEQLAKANTLRITVGYFTCPEKSTGLCLMQAVRWEMPLQASPDSQQRSLILQAPRQESDKKAPPSPTP